MLVLSRRIGEMIMIGELGNISIKVLAINGCQVKLGIEAPKDIPIHRKEIYNLILAEKKEACYVE